MMKLTAFTLLVAMIGMTEAKMQNVTVKGVVICNKMAMHNVLVELWEKDTLDPNDLLKKIHTDHEGKFTLSGGDDEITSIDPYIKITHNCKASAKPDQTCTRSTEYIVPKNFINNPLPYDMTFVNLDIFVTGEKEKCVKRKN